jgi:2,3-dihydroxyphenylpropionate 1,2-dioxygenase
MGFTEPAVETRRRVDMALGGARKFVADFDPELVVLFGPDHYNGFFYDMMPSFCIGASAESIGDYDTPAGPLLVDHDVAWTFARAALDAGIDVALSERMSVDHGFAQPLEVLFGGLGRTPVVPVFINCVAEPMGPARRARLLGSAIGLAAASLNRRVLIIGSGGLSHDPPVPRLEGAAPEVAAALISEGRRLTPEQRAGRQSRVIQAGRDYAAGVSTMQPLNPDWDRNVLAVLASGELEQIDAYDGLVHRAWRPLRTRDPDFDRCLRRARRDRSLRGDVVVLRADPGLDRRLCRHYRATKSAGNGPLKRLTAQ